MKIYTYVIATDAGSAPNFEPPLATLAICKPRIRLGAEPGDMVLAFDGKSLGPNPHAVRWCGIVCEKLEFHEYWLDPRFRGKRPDVSPTPDNIYELIGASLSQVPNRSHASKDVGRDLGGRFVLVFDPVWYFGNGGPVLPDTFGLRLIDGRRGHRAHKLPSEAQAKLKRWLNEQRQDHGSRPRGNGRKC